MKINTGLIVVMITVALYFVWVLGCLCKELLV